MEILCKRFPFMIKRVLNNLNDKSLTTSKESCWEIYEFLENERFYWKRIINKNYLKNYKKFQGFEESWKEVIYKTPFNVVKQLASAVQSFCKSYELEELTPLQIAVTKGSLEICEYFMSKMQDINAEDHFGWKLLHWAALGGNLDNFKLIFEKVDDKNPRGEISMRWNQCRKEEENYSYFEVKKGDGIYKATLLYIAAAYGNAEICKFIMDNGTYENFEGSREVTPLTIATVNGHFEVCKLIIGRIAHKNPAFSNGRTLLHLAAANGKKDVYRLIMEEVENKNPPDQNGSTPLHEAAYEGHLDVCKLIVDNIDNKNPKNNYGETPKYLADDQNYKEISQLFQN